MCDIVRARIRSLQLFVDKVDVVAENLIINPAEFESTTCSCGFLQSAEVYDEH
jgi:hypothetical protein